MRLITVALLSFLAAPIVAAKDVAQEKYEPLYEMDAAYEPSSITESYMKAYRSPTVDGAIDAWKEFIEANSYDEEPEVSDLTDLTLIRQAHYELVRLYYINGRKADADSLLKKANELTVFSSPEPGEGKKWCRTHGYCQ